MAFRYSELDQADYPDICQNCPAARGLIAQYVRFQAKPIGACEKFENRERTLQGLEKLNEASKQGHCNQIIKDLPSPEVEVPELGVGYFQLVGQCLSYKAYRELI